MADLTKFVFYSKYKLASEGLSYTPKPAMFFVAPPKPHSIETFQSDWFTPGIEIVHKYKDWINSPKWSDRVFYKIMNTPKYKAKWRTMTKNKCRLNKKNQFKLWINKQFKHL